MSDVAITAPATTATATVSAGPSPGSLVPIEQPIAGGHFSTVLMVIILMVVIGIIVRVMIRENNNKASPIYLRDLITRNGVVYLPYVLCVIGVLIYTWVLFYTTLKGVLTDAIFIGYGTAIIIPVVAAILKGNDPNPPPPSPLAPPIERKAEAANGDAS